MKPGFTAQNCDDLRTLGNQINGFYVVKTSNGLVSVLCDFTQAVGSTTKIVGNINVQSQFVYFYVQRTTSYTVAAEGLYETLPFEKAQVNVGNAMNLISNTFTAPTKGVYFFTFAAPAVETISNGTISQQSKVNVVLVVNNQLNSTPAGTTAYVVADPTKTPTLSTVVQGMFQTTLVLNAGDTVSLSTANSLIIDPTKNLVVQFSGMFLQPTS